MAKRGNVATLEELAAIASALGEPRRLMALAMLSKGELCLCHLTEGLGISASTVSNHMAVLRRAGLVEARKDGRWMHFRLAGSGAPRAALRALSWVSDNLPESVNPARRREPEACLP